MDLSEEIQDLVYRYLQGEATAEECSRLQAIFADGKEARQAFEQMARAWQYGKYAGTEITVDGKTYLIMKQSDILATL